MNSPTESSVLELRNVFPSSQRRGGCAEGADGVARSASPIGRSLNRRPAKRFGRTDHPGAPASIKLSRHPSSARRGMRSGVLLLYVTVFMKTSTKGEIFGPNI